MSDFYDIRECYGMLILMLGKRSDEHIFKKKIELLNLILNILEDYNIFCDDIKIDTKKHCIIFINPNDKKLLLEKLPYRFPVTISYKIK